MYYTSDVFFLSLWQWPCSTWTRYKIPHHSCSEASAPDDCFYWQEMRWQIKTLCFPLRIAVSCDVGLFWNSSGGHWFDSGICYGTRTMNSCESWWHQCHSYFPLQYWQGHTWHASFPHSILDFSIHSQYSFNKNFQTALFSGQVCNLMELCWEKLINSFLSVKSREELDLILAALAKSQLVLVLSYDCGWFIIGSLDWQLTVSVSGDCSFSPLWVVWACRDTTCLWVVGSAVACLGPRDVDLGCP